MRWKSICFHGLCDGDGVVVAVEPRGAEIATACRCYRGEIAVMSRAVCMFFDDAIAAGMRQAEWHRDRVNAR